MTKKPQHCAASLIASILSPTWLFTLTNERLNVLIFPAGRDDDYVVPHGDGPGKVHISEVIYLYQNLTQNLHMNSWNKVYKHVSLWN